MCDNSSLLDQLSRRFELTGEQEELLSSRASISLSTETQSKTSSASTVIGLSTSVSTFVAKKNFHNFAVPQFASHWGVICDFSPESRMLFHLQYDSVKQKVTFDGTTWKDDWTDKHAITPIGKSSYQFPIIHKIGKFLFFPRMMTISGKQLVNEFDEIGGYHFLFWNCQTFVKIFLRLMIHDPPNIDFKSWSSADVTRLVKMLRFKRR